MIIPSKTKLIRIDGEQIEFVQIPEQGAWYEKRAVGYSHYIFGKVGMRMFPMLANGEPDLESLTEIEVEWGKAND